MIFSKEYTTSSGSISLINILIDLFKIPSCYWDKKSRKPGPRIILHYILFNSTDINYSNETKNEFDLKRELESSVFIDDVLQEIKNNRNKYPKALNILFEISFPNFKTNDTRQISSYLSKSLNQNGKDKVQGDISFLTSLIDFSKLTIHLSNYIEDSLSAEEMIIKLFDVSDFPNPNSYFYSFAQCCDTIDKKLSICIIDSLLVEQDRYMYYSKTFKNKANIVTGLRVFEPRAALISPVFYYDKETLYDIFGNTPYDINTYKNKLINISVNYDELDSISSNTTLVYIKKTFIFIDIYYKDKPLDYYNNPKRFWEIKEKNSKELCFAFSSIDKYMYMNTAIDKMKIHFRHLDWALFYSDRTFNFEVFGYIKKGIDNYYIKPVIIFGF